MVWQNAIPVGLFLTRRESYQVGYGGVATPAGDDSYLTFTAPAGLAGVGAGAGARGVSAGREDEGEH
jgi:hypothetical protein